MKYPLKNWRKIKRGYRFGEKTFYSDFHLGTDYIVLPGTLTRGPHLHIDLSFGSVDPKNHSNFIDPENFFSGTKAKTG